jgi:hypothetical protein
MPNCFQRSRRSLLVTFLLVVCASAVSRAIYSDLKRRGPFWDKYQRVQPGMTQKEVERILGPPADEMGSGGIGADHSCCWRDGQQTVVVYFNFIVASSGQEQGAIRKRFHPETVWEGLCPEDMWEKRLGPPLVRRLWRGLR